MTPTDKSFRPLRHDEITAVLAQIGKALAASGHHASIYVAGGAAMALRYGARARDVTDDVDALFQKDERILREAERIATERGLDSTWLNDRFSAFMPREEDDLEATVVRFGGLEVSIASPEFLLAMKMHAGRGKDLPDAVLLVQELRLTSASEIADLTVALYGDGAVPAVDPVDVELYAEMVLRKAKRVGDRTGSSAAAPQVPLTDPGQGRVRAGSRHGGRFTSKVNSAPTAELQGSET